MTARIEISEGVHAKVSTHESGEKMIVVNPFRPIDQSAEEAERLLKLAKQMLKTNSSIVRICLGASQRPVIDQLIEIGFYQDGVKFGSPYSRIRDLCKNNLSSLMPEADLRVARDERDIEHIVEFEKSIHAVDASTRVSFDSEGAVESMKVYYRQCVANSGVYLLEKSSELIAVAGFMPDAEIEDAIHVSSIGVGLGWQRRGLLIPFLSACLEENGTKDAALVTGVTTTKKLLSYAKEKALEPIGYSLMRRE